MVKTVLSMSYKLLLSSSHFWYKTIPLVSRSQAECALILRLVRLLVAISLSQRFFLWQLINNSKTNDFTIVGRRTSTRLLKQADDLGYNMTLYGAASSSLHRYLVLEFQSPNHRSRLVSSHASEIISHSWYPTKQPERKSSVELECPTYSAACSSYFVKCRRYRSAKLHGNS